jgi:hypothetical protein
MNDKLKKVIFDKLYMNLSDAEIIKHDNSIWFIDRDQKYWYLQYNKSGKLWWRYDFFNDFFMLFSMEKREYESIIIDWVEEVLNNKVITSDSMENAMRFKVEEVLNCKVKKVTGSPMPKSIKVGELLNDN